jgi:AraC-like DNA-binding protein
MEALHELRELAERHARPGPLATVERDDLGLKLIVARRGADRSFDYVFERQLGVVVHGEKRVAVGDRRLTYGAGSCFVAGLALPAALQLPCASPADPFVAVSVTLDPARVAALLADTPHGPDDEVGLGVSVAPTDVLEAVVRLVRLLDRPRDIPVLGPLVERELLWRLLCSDQGGRLRQIGRADSRLSQIGRAMRWIRDHYRDPLRIDDLARLAGMSATSFHRHFRAVAAMTPLQYQKQLRLQRARAALLAGGEDVARVGHAVGYESPSQFSREYKRAYGAPPSRTRRVKAE